ncbi:hypothetical protein CIG19_07210 [Enterobacterales bacterium CwR94]|nr:hypothetical protein CIG19_07210 [Enterobacterales bacterium CwR94]
MNNSDFSTKEDVQSLASEVACLKALVTLMLKSMGQADAGKVIIKLEDYVNHLNNPQQAEVFSETIKQIKTAFRK